MKCPDCGKWNSSSMPHCIYCGAALEDEKDYSAQQPLPWQSQLKDGGQQKAYIRVDEEGDVENAQDPRDALASEMVELKARKIQGEMQQRRLRAATAKRGMAPSGRTVRTTTNRSTFFSVEDNPDTTLRPVDPRLVDQRELSPSAQPVYPPKYRAEAHPSDPYAYGMTHRMEPIDDPNAQQQVYDGFHDTSAYMPTQPHPDEYEHSMTMRNTASWTPRRVELRRLLRALIILLVVAVVAWVGVAVVWPMIQNRSKDEGPQVTVTATIRDDLAAHTITIPGTEGDRITIRELRTSAIVTGGVATFDIPDHVWYDEFEDYLQETMPVTLTPFFTTASGKQQPLTPIDYDIDIPLSPIELETPDSNYQVVSTPLYNIVFRVREGSTLTINGENYSDLVNTDGGKVSYNATVQPTGENVFQIVVKSQYCRENSLKVTLFREKQEVPLDLASDIGSRSTSKSMLVRASTLPGATVNVTSPHTDLNITSVDVDGSFSFYAVFDHIGYNTIQVTADYAGKKQTLVEYDVYYVPSIDDYSRAAWSLVKDYNDLLENIDLRKKKTQIYECKGTIMTIETTKPQRAFINCGTEEEPVIAYLENQSRTTWEEGVYYRIYADAYGMYNSKPWLIARYTYTKNEK